MFQENFLVSIEAESIGKGRGSQGECQIELAKFFRQARDKDQGVLFEVLKGLSAVKREEIESKIVAFQAVKKTESLARQKRGLLPKAGTKRRTPKASPKAQDADSSEKIRKTTEKRAKATAKWTTK